MKPVIHMLHSQSLVNPFELKPEDVHLEDLARGLSAEMRFKGQTPDLYSVAYHSVLVSWIVQDLGGSVQEQIKGLLHDAAEYLIPDFPTPVKGHYLVSKKPSWEPEEIREVEQKILNTIFEGLHLPPGPLPEIVKEADGIALATEWRDLLAPTTWTPSATPSATRKVGGVSSRYWAGPDAMRLFMWRYRVLRGVKT